MNKLDLYTIDLKYVRDLSNADSNVASISPQIGKQTRPFVGVVVLLNGKNYCIPLTSPKEKFNRKSQVDFIKILDDRQKDKNGASKLIGVLNINNMIPVDVSVISKVNLSVSDNDLPNIQKYKQLMCDQIRWCRNNSDTIINRANKVYSLVVDTPEKNRNLTRRCLNFKKLESVLEKYLDKSASQSKGIGDTQSKPQTAYMSRESLKKLAAEIRRQESTRERTVKKSKNNHEL